MIKLSPLQIRSTIAVLALSAGGAVNMVLNENISTTAYLDSGKVPTIGIGSTKGVKMGDKITVPQAFRRFIEEINVDYEGPLKRCLGPDTKLTQGNYDALVDLSYNAGGGATCREIVPLFNAAKTEEDFSAACKSIELWRITVKGRDCRDRKNDCYGLVTRRKEISKICEGRA